MADKTIGELPRVAQLDREALLVAEQQGQARSVSGGQILDFANVETAAQVEAAKQAAQDAAEAAQAAENVSTYPPRINATTGNWEVWSAETNAYTDTGIKAQGPMGPSGGVNSVNGKTGAVSLTGTDIPVSSSDAQSIAEALSDKAPGGFGLGANSKKIISDDDLINIKLSGWYYFKKNDPPTNAPDYFARSLLRVDGLSDGIYRQTIYDANAPAYGTSGACAVREIYNNAPSEWEWVNPPLKLGVEYRTTEQYNAKPVYTKVIDFGALPNKADKTVATGLSNVQNILSCIGTMDNGNTLLLYNYGAGGIVSFFASPSNIYIKTDIDLSGITATVTLKYTKRTD